MLFLTQKKIKDFLKEKEIKISIEALRELDEINLTMIKLAVNMVSKEKKKVIKRRHIKKIINDIDVIICED